MLNATHYFSKVSSVNKTPNLSGLDTMDSGTNTNLTPNSKLGGVQRDKVNQGKDFSHNGHGER
jgi:hypothetical protein